MLYNSLHQEAKASQLDQQENDMTNLTPAADWQTKNRGTNSDEYQTYLALADDGKGNEFMTGKPLKSYDEWLNS